MDGTGRSTAPEEYDRVMASLPLEAQSVRQNKSAQKIACYRNNRQCMHFYTISGRAGGNIRQSTTGFEQFSVVIANSLTAILAVGGGLRRVVPITTRGAEQQRCRLLRPP
jgi:hypothetical protein